MKFLVVTAAMLLSTCGYVGPPQPPALNLPQRITDFRATQTGDKIAVHFTTPTKTTESLPVTTLRTIELAIGPGNPTVARDVWEKSATRYQIPATDLGSRDFDFRATEFVGQQVAIGVRTTGSSGRESEWSNYMFLSVGMPLAKPSALLPTNTAKGVELHWTGNAPKYRVLRSVLNDPMPVYEVAGESTTTDFVDTATIFGSRYAYVVMGISDDLRESPRSDPEQIETIDKFAPAVPTAFDAISAGRSVDLSWMPSSDDDLAGYNLFRAVDAGEFELYQRNLAVPAFHDTSVESGKRYRYKVSAFDKAGNESDRSEEKSAVVQ